MLALKGRWRGRVLGIFHLGFTSNSYLKVCIARASTGFESRISKYFCLEALAASLPTLLSSAHTDALCILAQGHFRFIVRETFK